MKEDVGWMEKEDKMRDWPAAHLLYLNFIFQNLRFQEYTEKFSRTKPMLREVKVQIPYLCKSSPLAKVTLCFIQHLAQKCLPLFIYAKAKLFLGEH